MEPIIDRIKSYVLVLDSTITNNAFLDFIVNDVVDRALVYMNRAYLKTKYESDLEDVTVEESDYVLPLPKELERVLAGAVIGTLKTVKERNDAETSAVKSMSDNGQSVSFGDQISNYMSTTGDNEIFLGIRDLLDNYKLGEVLKNVHSRKVQDEY
jgi:hypothetical protein